MSARMARWRGHCTRTGHWACTKCRMNERGPAGSLISFTESWPRALILIGTSDQLIDASREFERRLAADRTRRVWWMTTLLVGGGFCLSGGNSGCVHCTYVIISTYGFV